jgi:hypothetical protein
MTREPLVTRATIVTIATAVLSLLVTLGLHIDKDTKVAILGVVAALAPLVVAALTRHKVTPVTAPSAD